MSLIPAIFFAVAGGAVIYNYGKHKQGFNWDISQVIGSSPSTSKDPLPQPSQTNSQSISQGAPNPVSYGPAIAFTPPAVPPSSTNDVLPVPNSTNPQNLSQAAYNNYLQSSASQLNTNPTPISLKEATAVNSTNLNQIEQKSYQVLSTQKPTQPFVAIPMYTNLNKTHQDSGVAGLHMALAINAKHQNTPQASYLKPNGYSPYQTGGALVTQINTGRPALSRLVSPQNRM